VTVVSKDITERKQAEDALRESEKQASAAIEAARGFTFNYDIATGKIKWGGAIEEITGYTPEEFSLVDIDGWAERIHPDDRDRILLIFQEAFQRDRATAEYRFRTKNGDYITLSSTSLTEKDEKGKAARLVGILQDITERKQAEEELRRSNEELLKEHNQRMMLSKSLIDLLEKDRRQIAMELHDHIGQTLTSLKMNLEMIHGKLKPGHTELGTQIKVAQERAIQAIKDVKNISHGLRPAMIDALGVVSSLRDLFNEIQQQTDIEIHFFSRGIPKRFEEEKELAVYRIAQEALGNIIRHTQAKNVFVNLVKKDEKLSLSVEDDGVGFDQAKVMKISKKKGPLGLLIMRERTVQLDGEFTIESQPGKGTHLLVEIPL
jgi:PAS domain S-box-containing protein